MPGIFIAPAVEVRELLFFWRLRIGLQLLNLALEVHMKRFKAATLIALSLLLLPSLAAHAQNALPDNAQGALQWLQCTQQQANGQIGSGGNPIARSSEVAIGLAAAGQPTAAMHAGALSLADYLKTAVSTDVGTNGELLLARASETDAGPTATLAAQLQASRSSSGSTAGEYGGDIFSDALAILGLRADRQVVGQDAIEFLKAQQKSDGGWSFDNADQFGTDSNTTALVIQALLSAGVAADDAAISKGFDYLNSVFGQGGFGDTPGAGPDPNSDELAIQAILAAGRQHDATWGSMLNQALDYLVGQQITSGPDKGAIANSFSKLFATTDAPAVFLLRPLTVVGLAETKVPLLSCPAAAATPTPTPTPTPTVAPATATPAHLAQTGAGTDARPLLLGLVFVLIGLRILRPTRRARS